MTVLSVTRGVAIVALAGAVAAATAREIRAFGRPHEVPSQNAAAPGAGAPVKTLPAGQRFAVAPGQKGATYFWLEGRTERITTRFADAVVVAERGADGDLHARISDGAGNEVAHFKVDRVDESTHVLQYTPTDGRPLQAVGEPSLRPTLDWANRQAYSLWKDRVNGDDGLMWQGGVMRRAGSVRRDLESEVVELRTDWSDGLSATAVRVKNARLEVMKGRLLHGDAIVSRLYKYGVPAGRSNWFPEQQFFLWDLPGVSQGYLDPKHLEPIGGWHFQPDIAWVNLQTIAFDHFKSLLDSQGVVAEREPSMIERISHFFVAPLHANSDGCDGLHWLDGTIYRFCCDTHDYCYSRFGCTSYSWWQWWTSWQCDGCNLMVVGCFFDLPEYPMQHIP
jgi:hypothetical protein